MKKILTFGVFDYFHLGHLRLFKQCKEYADYLIVAVQNGEYILKFKPDANVLYSTEERVEILEALRIVDKVLVYDSVDIEDHRGERFDKVEQWCIANGKEVVRLKRTQGICSSDIKEELKGRE